MNFPSILMQHLTLFESYSVLAVAIPAVYGTTVLHTPMLLGGAELH